MHKRFVANIVSRICLVGCFLMTWPLGWAIHDDIHSRETTAFIASILIGIILSAACVCFFRLKKEDSQKLNIKDGLSIVGLSWIISSLLGALPLFLSGVVPTFTDAFFETVSGFTTTGATVFADVESLPRGILFWRSLTHWLGGMGLIVLYIALLPAFGINTFQLYKAESSGLMVDKVDPRLKETAKRLWWIYFILTFIITALLILGGMPIFDALCHAFGAIATGGFSTKNINMGAYDAYAQWVVIGAMFLGGVNFILHFQALRGRPQAYFKNEEFRFYFFFVLIIGVFFAGVLKTTGLSASPLRDAFFQVISILTSTGYVTTNFDLWPHVLRFLFIVFMFMGGCGGSTSGGLKIIRIILLLKISLRSVMQAVFPNAILPVKFNNNAISDKLVVSILSHFAVFMLLFFCGTVLFVAAEGCDLVTAITAVISTFSNIGCGLGKVGPSGNYGWISIPGKWLLTFLMLVGRLELYSILILLMPSTWKK